jgi:hypothetical protein
MYPEFLIIDTTAIVCELEEQLNQNWLFTVDVEFVLENIFTSFIMVGAENENFTAMLEWIVDHGFDLKTDNTPLQLEFVIDVIRQTTKNIYNVLLELGYLNNEQFPYKFKRINADKTITVTKLPDN